MGKIMHLKCSCLIMSILINQLFGETLGIYK